MTALLGLAVPSALSAAARLVLASMLNPPVFFVVTNNFAKTR